MGLLFMLFLLFVSNLKWEVCKLPFARNGGAGFVQRGIPRKLRGKLEPPASVEGSIFYLDARNLSVESDADFLAIKTTKVAAAKTAVGLLRTKQEDFLRGKCTSGNRNEAFRMAVSKSKIVLAYVQKFANKHINNAHDIFTRNGYSIISYKRRKRGPIEVEHGRLEGTFNLFQTPMGQGASYIWLQRIKGTTKWHLADFSHKSTGVFIDGIVGEVYEFKAQYKLHGKKSAFTQIIEIICI
jgi:hypothetical protein